MFRSPLADKKESERAESEHDFLFGPTDADNPNTGTEGRFH
jgi:hypothetical protein